MRHTGTPRPQDRDFNPYLRLRTFIKLVICLFSGFKTKEVLSNTQIFRNTQNNIQTQKHIEQLTQIFITIYRQQKRFVCSTAEWHRLCVGSLDPVSGGALFQRDPTRGLVLCYRKLFPRQLPLQASVQMFSRAQFIKCDQSIGQKSHSTQKCIQLVRQVKKSVFCSLMWRM